MSVREARTLVLDEASAAPREKAWEVASRWAASDIDVERRLARQSAPVSKTMTPWCLLGLESGGCSSITVIHSESLPRKARGQTSQIGQRRSRAGDVRSLELYLQSTPYMLLKLY